MKTGITVLLSFTFLCLLISVPSMSEEWIDPTEYKSSPHIGFSAVSILPYSDFGDLYKSGFGLLLDLSYSPDTIRNWKYSFKTGVIQMQPVTESESGYKTGFGNGYIFPLLGNIEYRYTMPFWRRLKLAPALSAGMAIITVTYDDRSETIKDGVPTGWAAEKDSTRASADPMALAGFSILCLVNYTDYIFIRFDGGVIYETEKSMFFASINAGYEKRF